MCAYPKIETAFVPSSHTTFHWAPPLPLHSLLSLSSLFSLLFSSLLFSCTGFVGVPWLKCSQTVIGSFVLALLPFSDFLFHFTFCFSFLFSLFSVYLLLLHESWARKCWSCTGAYRFRQLMWHRQLPAQIWKTESLPKTKSSKNKKILCNR